MIQSKFGRSPSERLARITWWSILRIRRFSPAKNLNHKIAGRLSPEHAAKFLARGKAQNAFARKHAVAVIRFGINVLILAMLCWALYLAAGWLFEHGYFTAPGSPQRQPSDSQ